MKRFLLLAACYFGAALGLNLYAGNLNPEPAATQDTILIKLPNGASMTLFLKDMDQLKSLQEFQFDSLMDLMSEYVEQSENLISGKENKEFSMIFNTDKKLNTSEGPEKVRVMIMTTKQNKDNQEENNRVKVLIDYKDKAFNDSIKFTKNEKRKNKKTKFETNLDLGFNTFAQKPANNSDLYDLKPFGSRYFSVTQYLQTRIGGANSPVYLRPGIELAFNNYMFDKNNYLVDNDGVTQIVKENTRTFEKSKLATTFLNIPVTALLKFKDKNGKEGFKLGFGGFAGYRLGTHSKLKYEKEGKTYKDKERSSFNTEDYQYGVSFTIGYRDLELFTKYNLTDLFKENRGPKVSVVSFGFRL